MILSLKQTTFKTSKVFPQNSCPFFWFTDISLVSFGSCYKFHPWCGIEMYHKKSEAKNKSADTTGKSFLSWRMSEIFSHLTLNNSLFSCPATHVPTPSMSNIQFFCRFMWIENYSFLSPHNFPHTTWNVGGCQRDFLIHEMKSSYIILILFFLFQFYMK